jgi:hypothetical protein
MRHVRSRELGRSESHGTDVELQPTGNWRDIVDAVAALPAKQELNTQTRAVQAAAFWQRHQSLVVREEAAGANLLTDLERIKWLLWHGNEHRAGETSGFFLDDVDALQVDYPNLHKFACAAHEFGV